MITLTFDNLGEATALQRGTWDGSAPLGADPSVTVALPRLLAELDALALRATFHVEAINCELNPAAVTQIAERGHELAAHGWRHEPWAQLAPDHERALLGRSREAFAGLGLHPVGFRPPGGKPAPGDPARLAEHGFTWHSAVAGEAPSGEARAGGAVTAVPFTWELVDAYWLMDSFSALRGRRGDGAGARTPAQTAAALAAQLDDAAGDPVVVLHPFLMLDGAWWEHTRVLLAQIAGVGAQTVGEAAGAA